MQNPDFLAMCVDELEQCYSPIEIVEGDRYHPIWAVKINHLEMPDTVLERHVDVLIPLARCAGYLPGAALAGVHVSRALHGVYAGETTVIPFCDPVEDTDWLIKTQRFYPLYEHNPENLIGTSYLCLNEPEQQPETPLALLEVAMRYLGYWPQHCFNLAAQHGAIARGVAPGDKKISAEWVEHLVERTAPGLRTKLLAAAYPAD